MYSINDLFLNSVRLCDIPSWKILSEVIFQLRITSIFLTLSRGTFQSVLREECLRSRHLILQGHADFDILCLSSSNLSPESWTCPLLSPALPPSMNSSDVGTKKKIFWLSFFFHSGCISWTTSALTPQALTYWLHSFAGHRHTSRCYFGRFSKGDLWRPQSHH